MTKCRCITCGGYPIEFFGWREHQFLPRIPEAKKCWNLANDLATYGPFGISYFCHHLLSRPMPVGLKKLFDVPKEMGIRNANTITFRRFKRFSD